MDSLSSSLKKFHIPVLDIFVLLDGDVKPFGQVGIRYIETGEIINIDNVNIERFLDTIHSYCYAILLYNVFGRSYLEDTDVCIQFQNQHNGEVSFLVLEGDVVIHQAKSVSRLDLCAQVGKFSRDIFPFINRIESEAIYLGNPRISFNLHGREV